MSQPLKPVLALALATGVALSGCATSPPPTPSGADVRGQVPAEGLPYVSRIVANELPIALVGFWNDPKEREEFEKRRAEEIARLMESDNVQGEHLAGSLTACATFGPLCPVLLPVLIPISATTGYTHARIRASRGAAYIPISEANSQRLSALFSGTLTGVALGERTLALARTAPAPSGTEAGFPRLVVTMKSATVRMDTYEELHVTVVAEAQAQPAPGVTWAPTEHVIDMEFWQRYDYTVAVQKILDVLAQSIVATYLPQHPHSVEQRHWDDVRTKDAARVQTYLERYPSGTYAELARQRLGELSAQEAAAREAVTDAWAAKSLFRGSARARPELEGRWTGAAPVPFCGRTSYAIHIKDGYAEGTVEWQLSALVRMEVAGYVKEDGSVTVIPISSGRVDRSQSLDLVPRSGRLTGPSSISCVPAGRHLVTLGRD